MPAAPGAYPDGRIGTLTISLEGKRPGHGEHVSYAVHGHRIRVSRHREFLLRNLLSTAADTYDVRLDLDKPQWDTCTCTSGKFKATCKHRDALRALLAEGVFDAEGSTAMERQAPAA